MHRFLLVALASLLLPFAGPPPALADAPPVSSNDYLRVSVDPLPQGKLAPGTEVTISGLVEVMPPDSQQWIPADDVRVDLLYTATTRTDASGHYRFRRTVTKPEQVRVVARHVDTSGTKIYSDAPIQWLYVYRAVRLKLKLREYTPFGEARLTAEILHQRDTTGVFNVEFSTDRRRWRKVDSHKLRKGTDGFRFYPKYTQLRSGYWRLRYLGDTHHAVVVTPPVQTLRWRTEFSKIRVAQKSIRVGQKVTVSGTLYRYSQNRKKHFGYALQQVAVVFHCRGGKKWYRTATGKTNAKGRFVVRAKTYCDSSFAATFRGGEDTFVSSSPNEVYVETSGASLLGS